MTFWSGETLFERIPRQEIIRPFQNKQIDCASYTLRMGAEAYITPDYQVTILSRHKIYRLEKHEDFKIPAGQFGFLMTEEIVSIPNDALGFISLRTSLKFQGLINVSGFHVDPGFRGHLIYAVYNAGPTAINLARGMDMFKIWFADLDRHDSRYVRDSKGIENEHISPALIDNVPGEILSMQSLSRRLGDLESQLFLIKAIAGIVVTVAGIVFGVLKLLK